MIKFETNIDQKGTALLRLEGTPNEICKETAGMIRSIFESLNEKKDAMGIIFLTHLTENIKAIVHEYEMERLSHWEEILKTMFNDMEKKNKSKDIRESDFDSEEQFSKWLHGDKEDKDA